MGHLHHDEEWLPLLSAYADGECGEQEQGVVRRHLEGCARCREWLRQVRTDGEVFRRALLASAQGIDLSGRIGRGIAGMPTPERPQGQLPLGTAITRPDGAALFRLTLTETAIALAILLVLGAILFPVFARTSEKARQAGCASNLKQVVTAALIYAGENGDRLPDAAAWPEQLEPYVKQRMLYRCPADDSGAEVSYGMSSAYGQSDPGAFPDRTERVLFCDVDGSGRPIARHNGGTNCAFLDGHVKWLSGVPGDIGPAGDVTSPNGPPALTVTPSQSTR